MNLNDLNNSIKGHVRKKRLGRGRSSGMGKTSGRGGKGQTARSGDDRKIGFEGGQMPIYRRLPRRGFSNARFADPESASINVDRLGTFPANSTVNIAALVKAGFLKRDEGTLKVLGSGDLKVALTVEAQAFSAAAKEKIEKAGGKAVVVAAPKSPAKGADKSADKGAAKNAPKKA